MKTFNKVLSLAVGINQILTYAANFEGREYEDKRRGREWTCTERFEEILNLRGNSVIET